MCAWHSYGHAISESDLGGSGSYSGSGTEEELEGRPEDDAFRFRACRRGGGDDYRRTSSSRRIAVLAGRIATRCLRAEEECSRKEVTQARLFEEQLQGVRQVGLFPSCGVGGVNLSRGHQAPLLLLTSVEALTLTQAAVRVARHWRMLARDL